MFAAYNLFFGLVPGIDNSAIWEAWLRVWPRRGPGGKRRPRRREIRARTRNYAAVRTLFLFLAGDI